MMFWKSFEDKSMITSFGVNLLF